MLWLVGGVFLLPDREYVSLSWDETTWVLGTRPPGSRLCTRHVARRRFSRDLNNSYLNQTWYQWPLVCHTSCAWESDWVASTRIKETIWTWKNLSRFGWLRWWLCTSTADVSSKPIYKRTLSWFRWGGGWHDMFPLIPSELANDTKNSPTRNGESGDSSPEYSNIESPLFNLPQSTLLPVPETASDPRFSSRRTIASGCANSQMPKKQFRQRDCCPPMSPTLISRGPCH